MPFELTIAEGRGRGQRFSFDGRSVTIGRGLENDVVLNDPGVSRLHARITGNGREWILCDNGSANGTRLNGSSVTEAAQLRPGDRIAVGAVVFEFGARQGRETRATAVLDVPAGTPGAIGSRVLVFVAAAVKRWAKLPVGARTAIVVTVTSVVVALTFLPLRESGKRHTLQCPDSVAVDEDTASFSFGRGDVDVDCGARVVFGFDVPQATRALFHYMPGRVSSASELELRLNGKHLAWAPVTGARGEPQVISLPSDLLSKEGRNFVSLTDASNDKEWAVGKVRIELLAITPGDLVAARRAYERGRRKLDEKRIAPRNLFDAWNAFAEARRQMEGLTPRPPLYDEVAELIRDAERELDKECGRLLFAAARYERYGQDDRAQQEYRKVLLHFPGEDPTGCRRKAQENIVSSSEEAQ